MREDEANVKKEYTYYPMRILLVEDNLKLSAIIAQLFTEAGYVVDTVHDGLSGERRASEIPYDLIVLDVLLPEKNGIRVCQTLRSEGVLTPIIMLTALGEVDDRVEGLDSGADDYVVKPFENAELLARVRALLRRPVSTFVDVLSAHGITLNPVTRSAQFRGEALLLTVKEFSVLEYLIRHAGTVVTREQILEHCWDFAYSAFSNITDVYIKQLRQKLHDTDQSIIATIRGVGYTLRE